jgi:hypothetical protein
MKNMPISIVNINTIKVIIAHRPAGNEDMKLKLKETIVFQLSLIKSHAAKK